MLHIHKFQSQDINVM